MDSATVTALSTSNRVLPEGPPTRLARLILYQVSGPIDAATWEASLPEHPKLLQLLPASVDGLYLQVIDRDGADGWWGPIDPSVARLLPALAPLVVQAKGWPVGQLVTGLRNLWRHGWTGHGACVLAAIELAAWDLAGRKFGKAVADLLGTPPSMTVETYASLLGVNANDPERDSIAAAVTAAGYRIQKWRLPDGPMNGAAGLARNCTCIEALVAAAIPGQIAIECDRAWSTPYLRAFIAACPSQLAWIEEPLPPWEGIAPQGEASSMPIAGGEHSYTKHELQCLRGLSVYQPDVTFLAGLNEFAAATAEARDKGLIIAPHGNGLPAVVCVTEALDPTNILIEHHLTLEPRRQGLAAAPTVPIRGRASVSRAPGFGVAPSDRCVFKIVEDLECWKE